MASRLYPSSPLLAACTAIWRDDRILLARRDRSPNADTWAMPGGVVELGETLQQAAIREVKEETDLVLDQVVFNRFAEIIHHDQSNKVKRHFVLAMFAAISSTGKAVAGDDAAAVRWFTLDELGTVPLTGETEIFARESLQVLGI